MNESLGMLEALVFSLESTVQSLVTTVTAEQLGDAEISTRITALSGRVTALVASANALIATLPVPPPATL